MLQLHGLHSPAGNASWQAVSNRLRASRPSPLQPRRPSAAPAPRRTPLQSTVIPDDGSWPPDERFDHVFQLASPLYVPADTSCLLEVEGSGTATDSYFEFDKFSELPSGEGPCATRGAHA